MEKREFRIVHFWTREDEIGVEMMNLAELKIFYEIERIH